MKLATPKARAKHEQLKTIFKRSKSYNFWTRYVKHLFSKLYESEARILKTCYDQF